MARKAYEWPRAFGDVMREAVAKANQEHREFEAALKQRRKEFGDQVEEFIKQVAAIETKSDIYKREQVAAEVCSKQGHQAV